MLKTLDLKVMPPQERMSRTSSSDAGGWVWPEEIRRGTSDDETLTHEISAANRFSEPFPPRKQPILLRLENAPSRSSSGGHRPLCSTLPLMCAIDYFGTLWSHIFHIQKGSFNPYHGLENTFWKQKLASPLDLWKKRGESLACSSSWNFFTLFSFSLFLGFPSCLVKSLFARVKM